MENPPMLGEDVRYADKIWTVWDQAPGKDCWWLVDGVHAVKAKQADIEPLVIQEDLFS